MGMHLPADVEAKIEHTADCRCASCRGQRIVAETVEPPDALCDEKEFQAKVVKLAKLCGWDWVYHTHDSRRSEKGMPDLVLLRERDRRHVYIELKVMPHKPSKEQRQVLDLLARIGTEVYFFYPEQWSAIVKVLA